MTWLPHTRRLGVIWWTLFREFRTLRRFDPVLDDDTKPVRFVKSLVDLGPAFIKLGQILSTRPEILPDAYITALATLQEHAPEVPFEVIRATTEAELGGALSDHFTSFGAEPVASASLAQVHRATLADGTAVAVKVQRPDIDSLIARDLDALELGLGLLRRIAPRKLRRTNLSAFFEEFRRYTMNELDFSLEAQTMERFRQNFSGHAIVRIPKTYPKLTTRRILTMDWVDGMRLNQAAIELADDQKTRLVNGLVDVLLKMFVSDGLFHADLHPGNIVFHSDGRFTLLDFGMFGQLTGSQRDRFILYWLAVVQRQTRRAFHHFRAQTEALPHSNETAFYDRFDTLANAFYASPLRETSIAKVYLEMMQAGYHAGFVFPASLMLHAKALTTAEALLFELAPAARFEQLSRPYIAREYAARATTPGTLSKRVSQILPELLLLGEMPPQSAMDRDWDWAATKALAADFAAQSGLGGGDAGRHMLRAIVERHARAVLERVSPALNVHSVLDATWQRYDELEAGLAVEPTVGATITTHLAALTLACHDGLVAQGLTAEQGNSIVYDIGWSIYERMAQAPLVLARTLSSSPQKQMRIATNLFRHFPFGSPAYGWRDVDTDPKTVGFDCTKCPVAAFFEKNGASDLCVQTWCALDYPLAEKWGGRLARTGTIAMGRDHCDFRWHTDPSEKDEIHHEGTEI
ncbi:ubiquinone biosynthesis protein [Roseovarius lutimaris]|uniref:Ubiquinone biosynthesis protein n=1 Tax=Roseovarius lutimaris TaxID=1005928 RepID=A0A1I5DHM3_9RHOB|nr:AarF/UbiB family protein [Roseovarius lutimaris]SFN98301.1 ubiquinone biosynthesis protein [Roseovarius lutimaris]